MSYDTTILADMPLAYYETSETSGSTAFDATSNNYDLTVKDYRIILAAQITARERISGRVLLDQPVTGQTLLRVGDDLASAERQALPLLAEDLARSVVALLAEGRW